MLTAKKKAGVVHPLNKYYKPVDRNVHVLKEVVHLAELQSSQNNNGNENRLVEEERISTKNKKRIRDAILHITETAPISEIEKIHLWIDEIFDPEFENFNLNMFCAEDDFEGCLGGTNKTRRPKNWKQIGEYHRVLMSY